MIDDAMLGTLLELHGHDSSRFDETTAAGVVVLPLDEIDGRFGAFCLAKDPRSGAVTLAAALQALQDELSTPGVQMALMALALPSLSAAAFLSLSLSLFPPPPSTSPASNRSPPWSVRVLIRPAVGVAAPNPGASGEWNVGFDP